MKEKIFSIIIFSELLDNKKDGYSLRFNLKKEYQLLDQKLKNNKKLIVKVKKLSNKEQKDRHYIQDYIVIDFKNKKRKVIKQLYNIFNNPKIIITKGEKNE